MAIKYQFFYTMKKTKNVLFIILSTIALALSMSSCSRMGGFRNSKNPMRFEALCLSPIQDDSSNREDDSLNIQDDTMSEETGCGGCFQSSMAFNKGYGAALSASISE